MEPEHFVLSTKPELSLFRKTLYAYSPVLWKVVTLISNLSGFVFLGRHSLGVSALPLLSVTFPLNKRRTLRKFVFLMEIVDKRLRHFCFLEFSSLDTTSLSLWRLPCVFPQEDEQHSPPVSSLPPQSNYFNCTNHRLKRRRCKVEKC